MDKEQYRNEYIGRVNKAIDYITSHLDENLSLKLLAQVACFSPFHFHRIFKSIVGESINIFINRVRLERALFLLKRNPSLSISDIAYDCGFNSQSSFARAFKKHFGVSASQFDEAEFLKKSKIGKEFSFEPRYYLKELTQEEKDINLEVQIKRVPEMRLAYLRVIGGYNPELMINAYKQFTHWAKQKNLLGNGNYLMGMSQDDPEVTPLSKYRYDFCLTVPKNIKSEGEISIKVMPETLVAIHHCRGDIHAVEQAWNWMFKVWLPESGYQPASLPCYEVFFSTPEVSGWDYFDIQCCVPIKQL
jgi:AraC-like DNA-binding protein/DNA gyrase inhibitor GyrI